MIIENKKTHRRESVTKDQWQKIVDLGWSRSWAVIDSADEMEQVQEKVIPREIIDLAEKRKKADAQDEHIPEAENPPLDKSQAPGEDLEEEAVKPISKKKKAGKTSKNAQK